MSGLSIFLFGYFGGIAMNIMSWTELKNTPRPDRPETFSDPVYVVWFFVIPLLGGVLAYAYSTSGDNLTPIIAINVGMSAPLILKSLAAAIPQNVKSRIN